MAEYIDREAILSEIERREALMVGDKRISVDAMKHFIKNRPAADVAPVRHAKWEDKPNPQWRAYDIRYCSACGWSIHKSKLRNADLNWAYCPSCGALMDGGEQDA